MRLLLRATPLISRPAWPLLPFCLKDFEIHTANDVVPADLYGRQMPAMHMAPQRLPAHAERLGRSRDQDHVFHASKGTDLITTVKAYHSCVLSGRMVQCNRGQQLLGGRMTEQRAPYAADDPSPKRARKKHGASKHRLRFRVLERDRFRCHWCGTPARETKLVIDHIYPFSKGGADDPSNYVASCEPCNGGKGDLILEGSFDTGGTAVFEIEDPSGIDGSICEGQCSRAYLTLTDGKRTLWIRSQARPEFAAALRRAADKIEQSLASIEE